MNVVETLLKRYAAGEREFAGIDLCETNLSGINLSGANLSRATFSVTNLSGANLCGANLSGAKLNVARLSGANLSRANLSGAILNVANLVRADLRGADLTNAAAIRSEMVRVDMREADLSGINLNGADMREAQLRDVILVGANLNEVKLRGARMTEANLGEASLNGVDLSQADLSGANLQNAELRQANLSRANLSGANLMGANLRWAEMSGAYLRWADLSNAKLSGANLIGADLSDTNLLNATLIHADLTQARLIRADWIGADLTGATLTGAKLHNAPRFGLKTDGLTCNWLDFSPDGDRSQIQKFTEEESSKLFNATLPAVRILVDAPIDPAANLALAAVYYQLSRQFPSLAKLPSLEVGRRRTELFFATDNDRQLFTIAYAAIAPFGDADATQRNIEALLELLHTQGFPTPQLEDGSLLKQFALANAQTKSPKRDGFPSLKDWKSAEKSLRSVEKDVKSTEQHTPLPADLLQQTQFFKAPTQTVLTNSNGQTLTLYYHPTFGKRLKKAIRFEKPVRNSQNSSPLLLPSTADTIEFFQGCQD